MEYLLLHVPECDLPKRFLPSVNTSNPFISSTHSGKDDLKLRWLQDKAIKECGWPAHVVQDVLANSDIGYDWARLVKALNHKLMGDDCALPPNETDLEAVDIDELEAFGGNFVDDHDMKLLLPVAPLQLHVLFPSTTHSLPLHGDPPAMYITSGDAPPYVRLHVLSRLINAFREGTLADPGETVIMAIVRLLEEEWAYIQDNGPPDISHVLRYLLPRKSSAHATTDVEGVDSGENPTKGSRRPRRGNRDSRSDLQVKSDFELTTKMAAYQKILSARQKLPAFAAQDSFLKALQRSRCVVVVGETGCGKTTQRKAPASFLRYAINSFAISPSVHIRLAHPGEPRFFSLDYYHTTSQAFGHRCGGARVCRKAG